MPEQFRHALNLAPGLVPKPPLYFSVVNLKYKEGPDYNQTKD